MVEKEKIREYLNIINPNIVKIDKENSKIIDFTIEETIDRVKLYLCSEKVPKILERILSKIVNNGLKKALKEIEKSNDSMVEVDNVITNISDNGQSISYSNEIVKYFTNASDEELFTGFTSMLNRYRRVKVVHSKEYEE